MNYDNENDFQMAKNKIKNILEQKSKLRRNNFKFYFQCILFKEMNQILIIWIY